MKIIFENTKNKQTITIKNIKTFEIQVLTEVITHKETSTTVNFVMELFNEKLILVNAKDFILKKLEVE